jgi:thiol-disulfide isomerase/thioredoxin
MEETTQEKDKIQVNVKLFSILGGVLIVALAVGLVVSFKTNAFVGKKAAETAEANRPAEFKVTLLSDSNCEDCFKLDGFLAAIQKENVKFVEQKNIDWKSDEGKVLVEKYKIEKIPTAIFSGEINKNVKLKNAWSGIGEIIDGNFVLHQSMAPYIEVATGETKGKVEVFFLKDDSCADCYDVMGHKQVLGSGFGLPVQNIKVLSVGSGDGLAMKNKYNITMMPTFVLKGEVEAYESLLGIWSKVGTVEKDGTYVFREGVKQMGAYKNMRTGIVVKPVAATSTNQ